MRYLPHTFESKWQKKWLKEKTYEPDFNRAKKPFYNLMMFPYPSAEGLHVGNMYAFTGSDIYGRFKRMQGYDVFEPIGLDGFGIHSENYAFKVGRHPADQAKVSEKNFYRQLQMIGNGFAWNEHLETYDPEYYHWTQWIFTQMFKRGLAYRKKALVNWCPSCLTVLADEQVLAGECERCGTKVIKKDLEQWFFRTTAYAERLWKNLDTIDWSEKVKVAQKNWIGRSEGALITFSLKNISGQKDDTHSVEVFTTRPDTIFGVMFVAISAELAKKWLDAGWRANDEVKKYTKDVLEKRARGDHSAPEGVKTGVDAGIKAVNPANGEEIPVWVVNYVLGNVGTGAVMAVPAHDERDFDFAKKYNLPVSDAALVNAAEIVKKINGKKQTNYRLRDWLISRQRYWSPPIPMIFCEVCAEANRGEQKEMPGWHTVPEKDLPVKLPYIKNFRPTGTAQSPLASVEKFYKVRCPSCKSWARRETDVSDTFLDSAWYYLRYLDVKNKKKIFDMARAQKWLPVDMYIGGAEHSVLHLLYVRFLTMAMHDWKLLNFEEPFTTFRAHGLIVKDGAKMSKSKGNVVNPDEYIKAYGADALRMYLMFIGPFQEGGDFRDTGMKGITRFLEKIWRYVDNWYEGYVIDIKREPRNDIEFYQQENLTNKENKEVSVFLERTIKKVTEDIEALKFNTVISSLMSLFNVIYKEDIVDNLLSPVTSQTITKPQLEKFLKLLAPFAPHMTEELWQKIHPSKKFASIHHASWPQYDPQFIKEDTFELVIQVNGKIRGRVILPVGISEADAKKVAIEQVKQHLTTEPRKVIFVPNKLINFVV